MNCMISELGGRKWVVVLGVICVLAGGGAQAQYHSADTTQDYTISLSELLRVIQFFNSNGLHCESGTEDGYAPGAGSTACSSHDSDYNPQNWLIGLSELLRLIQFFNSEGYHVESGAEDGFGVGLPGGEGEGGGEGQAEGEGETVLPVAAFDASPRSGRIPVTVQFVDQSTAGSSPITGWTWSFGDGGSSMEQNPAHEYTVAGVYSVTLSVETAAGTDDATQSPCVTAYSQDVVINEFLASNATGLQDEDLEYSDWIELYNPNPMAVPLSNWALTDISTRPDKWVFPAVSIPAGGYLVVFASSKDRKPVDGSPLHANFKLNANDPDTPGYGEYLALFNTEIPARATTEFTPAFPTQTEDVSYGLPDGGAAWCFFAIPTPWDANGSDCTAGEGEGEGEGVLTVAFDGSPRSGRVPVTVQFEDQSIAGSSPITSWMWNFGDGGSSSEQHPSHEYTVAGVYSVTLTVETADGPAGLTQPAFITAYAQDVVINEFVASNSTGLQDEDLEYSDWVELYNPNPMAVPLANWTLTDDSTAPDKWVFPAVSIPEGGYLVVFASSKDRTPVDGSPLHTNFKMNADDPDTPGYGEYLALFNTETPPRATTLFDPAFPSQTADVSYGLPEGGTEWCFFTVPTPWDANGTDCAPKVAPVQLSYTRGYYDTPIALTMNCPTPDAQIRYTLDGTAPLSDSGMVFEGTPLDLSGPSIVRVSAFKEGYNSAVLQTHTYLIGMNEAMKALPAISIVGDPQESLYEPNGIWAIVGGEYVPSEYGGEVWQPVNAGDYNNVIMRGREYERTASLEYLVYDPRDGPGFQVNCGIRVHGGDYFRPRFRCDLDWTDKFGRMAFGLFFRGEYGPAALAYPFFGDIEVQSFDQLVLRSGHDDVYNPFFKDELVRRLYGDCGHVSAHGRFVHVFVNGEYKGYLNATEGYDTDFFQSWYGGDNNWDIICFDGVQEGLGAQFWILVYMAGSFDVSDPLVYEDITIRLDVVNFIDYLLVELYAANWDWPSNNWTAAQERTVEGQFRFYIWDAENSFNPYNLYQNGFVQNIADPPSGTGLNGDLAPVGVIYRGLKQNPDFRQLFGERVEALFGPGGALSQENVMARYTELYDELSPVIPDLDTYIGDVWIPQRQDILLTYIQEEGLLIGE